MLSLVLFVRTLDNLKLACFPPKTCFQWFVSDLLCNFEETVATTPEEVRQLGKAGWAKYDEMTINGTQMHFYRKPKRFGGLNASL